MIQQFCTLNQVSQKIHIRKVFVKEADKRFEIENLSVSCFHAK